MNIYLAGAFRNRLLIKIARSYLNSFLRESNIKEPKFKFTSSWLDQTTNDNITLKSISCMDYSGIDRCDVLVCFFPLAETGGAISEMGYALGANKKVIYVIEKGLFPGPEEIIDPKKFNSTMPLPVGQLKEFNNVDDLNMEEKGFIVHEFTQLLVCLEYYNKILEDPKSRL